MSVMENFLIIILALSSSRIFHAISATEEEDLKSRAEEMNQSQPINQIMEEILKKKIPNCELVLLNDEYCTHLMLPWIPDLIIPTYTLNLDRPYRNNTFKKLINKYSEYSTCTNIIICCQSVKTCTNPDSRIVFKMLEDNGILKLERRSFLFIANQVTLKLYPEVWYEKRNSELEKFSLTKMKEAAGIVKGLNSHVTLIMRYIPKESKVPDYYNKTRRTETILQLLTWTSNWVPGGTPVIPHIWSTDRGFWMTKHYKHDQDLKLSINDIRPGGTVRYCTASKNLLPMIQVDDANNNIKGFDAVLIQAFADRFNMKVTFFEPEDFDFGKEKSGNWTGVIGHVIRKESDFGIGQISYTSDRFKADLKFSPGFAILQGVVICPLPKYLPRWIIMFAPFKIYKWFSLLGAFITGLCFFELLQRIMAKLFKQQNERLQKKNLAIWFTWINVVGPMFQQSVQISKVSRKVSFLVILGSWMIFAFIVSICYSTILIGILSFPPQEDPIDSLRELSESKLTWALSGLVKQTIINRVGTIEGKIVEKATDLGAHSRIDGSAIDKDGYNYAMETGGCLVAEKARSLYIISTDFSKLVRNHPTPLMRISKESFVLGPTGWAIRGDIDFMMESYFDNLFLNFRDSGMQGKLSEEFTPTPYKGLEKRPASPLQLETVQVFFYFLFLAYFISFFVFILEIVYFYIHQRLVREARMAEARNEALNAPWEFLM